MRVNCNSVDHEMNGVMCHVGDTHDLVSTHACTHPKMHHSHDVVRKVPLSVCWIWKFIVTAFYETLQMFDLVDIRIEPIDLKRGDT